MVLKCMTVLFKPILALHIINFSSCQNYWGGGGKTICLPPQYFHSGGGCRPGSTPLFHISYTLFCLSHLIFRILEYDLFCTYSISYVVYSVLNISILYLPFCFCVFFKYGCKNIFSLLIIIVMLCHSC